MEAGLRTDRWKKSVDDYVQAARTLIMSMTAKGFDAAHAVPVDPNGELLDGSHRVACALALELKEVPVVWQPRYVWAPPWDYAWFQEEGMSERDICRLYDDYEAMKS